MKQRILVVGDEPDLLELGNGSTFSVSLLAAEAEST